VHTHRSGVPRFGDAIRRASLASRCASSLNGRPMPDPSALPGRSSPVAIVDYNRGSVGARLWGQVRGFAGPLRDLRGRGAASAETTRIAGKAPYQARFTEHITAAPASMVRRGSPVRVRERALEKGNPRKAGIFVVWHSTTEHLRLTVRTALELAARFANACKSPSFPVRRSTSVKGRASTRRPRPEQPKVAGKAEIAVGTMAR
jgi:hypothetical protein